MQKFKECVKRFLVSEDGPTAVEYAVMLALIVIVCLTAIRAIGTNANTKFQASADALSDKALRSGGISPQKLRYLRDLSEHVLEGRLRLRRLARLQSKY